ncbi:MAG: DUF3822 family protein [Tannerella sp.]|jgi:hypothetical protein|nr:DUF3822 family protein [Tannerella sp.]
MAIRVPDTLTTDNSEKYEVSIRLSSGGLSFSGYIKGERGSFFYETASFDGDVNMIQSLKNIFFDNICLSYIYKSVYVVCPSGKYTLTPDSVYVEKNKDLLFKFCHKEDKSKKIIAQPLNDLSSTLIFEVDTEVYEFLARSLVSPQFVHSLSPMLLAWQKESLAIFSKQMYVAVYDNYFDVVCFMRDELLFVNSFDYETGNDIIYYVMYVCKRLDINQFDDCLHFYGNKTVCQEAMSMVRSYIGRLDYVEPAVVSYKAPLNANCFMDIVTLTECGL